MRSNVVTAFLIGLVVIMFLVMKFIFKPDIVYAPVNDSELIKKIDSISALNNLYQLQIEESESKISKYNENERRLRKLITDLNEKIDAYTKSDILLWLNVYERTNRYAMYPDTTNEEID